MIQLENKRLVGLITMKDDLVTEGRKITADIENTQKEIKKYEEKEKKITGAVKPNPILKAKGDQLVELFNKTLNEIEEIGQKIEKQKLEAIPKEMELEHKALLKKVEEMERERNKIALKIQKVKNKVIPLIQKEVKPLLQEYDDIETAKIKDGKVYVETFNHLEDFKKKFKKR